MGRALDMGVLYSLLEELLVTEVGAVEGPTDCLRGRPADERVAGDMLWARNSVDCMAGDGDAKAKALPE